MNRREFLAAAAVLNMTGIWATPGLSRSMQMRWREDRSAFPQGVASGDPDEHSVILWTRFPGGSGDRSALNVEVSRDQNFRHLVATARATVHQSSDWTCRVLVGGLSPATTYWYRFADATGRGSRIGRTRTAPRSSDPKPIRFAFVSCQSVNEGAQNAYRRMIWEDERAPPGSRLDFVLHLGDFIYEIVEYPDDVRHRYSREIHDIGRVPNSRKVGNFHVPTDLEGYRHVYRAHIDDPDIQEARAQFPFVCIGDNHEFSWQGWQSTIKYNGKAEAAQPLRVAANQAWWEYIPSRVHKSSGGGLDEFEGPTVTSAPIPSLDEHGFGLEPNNEAAVGSMTSYRALRFGRNVELILTDHHSYAMEDPTSRAEAEALNLPDYPLMLPLDAHEILDAGREYGGGRPPTSIPFGSKSVPNFRRAEPAFTALGHTQKAWLKDRLTRSTATWKIWGATNGTLDMRTDPQNLPNGLAKSEWPSPGYATFGGGDFSGALSERAEIFSAIREHGVSGFVTVSGDRHSFWAGYAAEALPPANFDPVGISFITGSISAPGLAEAMEYGLKGNPLRPLFVREDEHGRHEATMNVLLKHGVRSALEYSASGNIEKARALTNPEVGPHLEFVDMAGHGYSVVIARPDAIECEFVCIERPIRRAGTADGGPLRYRVSHGTRMWLSGERPKLTQRVSEGNADLSI